MLHQKNATRLGVMAVLAVVIGGLIFGGYALYQKLDRASVLEARVRHLEGQQQRLIAGHNEVVQAVKQMAPKPIQRTPLDQAGYEDSFIQAWIIQSQVESLTFAHHDYKLRLQRANRFYTESGFDFFVKALQKSEILAAVVDNEALMSVVPLEQPVFRNKGAVDGLYQWDVVMPARLVYRTGENNYTADWLLTIKVTRINDPAYVNGIAINSWAAFTYQPDTAQTDDNPVENVPDKK